MLKFRKKPITIKAVQFAGDVGDPEIMVLDLACGREDGVDHLIIETLEGNMKVSPGDWIIRGVEGELYPCKPAIFAKLYEAVDG